MNLVQFLNIFSNKNQDAAVFILKDLLNFSYSTKKKNITVSDCINNVQKRTNVNLVNINEYKNEFKEFLKIPNAFQELKQYDGEIRKMARRAMSINANKKLKEFFV